MEPSPPDAAGWLRQAYGLLRQQGENPAHEAQLLLAGVLKRPRAWLLAHPEQTLTGDDLVRLDDLLHRRISGEPLPYILGRWEFYGLEITVTPDVLIPRPETELLVEAALAWLERHPGRRLAADVGAGSGAISVALLSHAPDLHIVATDLSFSALRIPRQNLAAHGVIDRARLVQSDLLTAVREPLDLVCANLPYIPSARLRELDVARTEPAAALDGGADGLRLMVRLLEDANRWLAPGGLLLLEIEAGQGESAPALARRYFPSAKITVLPDLAGLPRLLKVENL
jgi:release factor glutamine methyltransferase